MLTIIRCFISYSFVFCVGYCNCSVLIFLCLLLPHFFFSRCVRKARFRDGCHSWVILFDPRVRKTCLLAYALRKRAYSNILKIIQPKIGKSSQIKFYLFHISAQNIDCVYSLEPPRRGGSNQYPQSMFLVK